jgi:mono/diheme cytochrome c family protein
MKFVRNFALIMSLGFLVFVACKKEVYDTTPPPSSPQCDTIQFSKHIKPLFDTHCISCHQAGGTGPGDFTDFSVIQAKKDAIKDRVGVRKDMPPNGPLPQEEIDLLITWIDCGAKPDSTGPPPPPKGPSYKTEIAPIFAKKCNGCHSGSGPGPGNFAIYDTVKFAVDNRNLEGRVFVRQDMPPSDTLSLDQRIKLKNWLDAGAPNN